MAIENKIIQDYFFELVERISRFYIHLDEIKSQFYFETNNRVNDKLIFIQSYKDCLIKFLEIGISLNKKIASENNIENLHQIQKLIISVNHLHKSYLSHLPRPSEPIELRRFARIIDKHALNLTKAIETEDEESDNENHISVYLSEEIGETSFLNDPVYEFKDKELNKIVDDYNTNCGTKIEAIKGEQQHIGSFHISIPRIDANNPCRWPTLMHEMMHKIMKKEYFNNTEIDEDFLESLDDKQNRFAKSLSNKISLKHWLTECWCDLFACIVTGPVFWFSQFSAFIFQEKSDLNIIDKQYPKALFRLKLIQKILEHRFSKILPEEFKHTMKSAESILIAIDQQDDKGFHNDDDIRELFLYFRVYFLRYFFQNDKNSLKFDSKYLNSVLAPLIKYTKAIDIKIIGNLVSSLEDGFPIPSKRLQSDTLSEHPTLIQEILLSAWLYRNNSFKKEILNILSNTLSSSTVIDIEDILSNKIINYFQRFDKSILRSIQVSEWFDFLEEDLIKEKSSDDKKSNAYTLPNQNVLNDFEIENYLMSGKLKIIPIMNLKQQMGSTSFDIRLGTSFQLYLHTKYGVIDFSDANMDSKIHNSKLVDLDFLESITISPGQFILGHSMEYLKLPSNIAGQVDGRSSFARLGLQVHMTAGFVDPGFEGVLTFEIFNAGPNPIKLFPGLRIAQLRFMAINKPQRPYNRNIEAKYKGLLTHHDSMQFKDYEIKKIRSEFIKKNEPSNR